MSIVFEPLAAAPPEPLGVVLLLLLPHALSARSEPRTRPPFSTLPRTLIYVPPLGLGPGLSGDPVRGTVNTASDASNSEPCICGSPLTENKRRLKEVLGGSWASALGPGAASAPHRLDELQATAL